MLVALAAALLLPQTATAQTPTAQTTAQTATAQSAAAGAPAAPAAANTPLPGRPDFITPAGEPIHSPDALSGAEHWFVSADADHDGRLTPAELRADGRRFFAALNEDHDGELGPEEIERYEFHVAPEIRVTSTGGAMVASGTDGELKDAPYPDRIGAGRFGYIDLPEPIIAMDANLDRAVSRAEFDRAMDARFALLDADHDGVITRAELPKIVAGGDRRRRGGRGDDDHRGHGRAGGGFGGGGVNGGGGAGAGGMGGAMDPGQ